MNKTMIASTFLLATTFILTGCENEAEVKNEKTRGAELAQKYIILDGHIDVPYRLEKNWQDVSKATSDGDFDYPRAKAGGLNAPFMSIYIPAVLQLTGGSKELADKLIDGVETIVANAPDKFAVATSVKDVQQHFAQGLISLPMGMENGSPIEGKLENLTHFYHRGVRYITLSHSKANHISDSSYDPLRPARGLTDFGKALVAEMNNIGMMIDVSHISDDSFYQVMELSKAPVIASHSSARHFTPEFERNMSDEMLMKLANNGGVIQINFGSTFISKKSRAHKDTYKAELAKFLTANTLTKASPEAKQFEQDYLQSTPFPYASLDDVLDHFDHVIQLIGIEHVGIGSDYDGVGDSLPTGLKDVASYPNLIDGLLERGYSEADISKILSGNVLRVWSEVEHYAAAH
ncbi:dipeptidase [Thalassotalea sp. ND16A]|uniref:dipeptidase n=1 Tax=Thalassotalea sp. ND16A TaxID=1535422 RepID=UPI00051A62ED